MTGTPTYSASGHAHSWSRQAERCRELWRVPICQVLPLAEDYGEVHGVPGQEM